MYGLHSMDSIMINNLDATYWYPTPEKRQEAFYWLSPHDQELLRADICRKVLEQIKDRQDALLKTQEADQKKLFNTQAVNPEKSYQLSDIWQCLSYNPSKRIESQYITLEDYPGKKWLKINVSWWSSYLVLQETFTKPDDRWTRQDWMKDVQTKMKPATVVDDVELLAQLHKAGEPQLWFLVERVFLTPKDNNDPSHWSYYALRASKETASPTTCLVTDSSRVYSPLDSNMPQGLELAMIGILPVPEKPSVSLSKKEKRSVVQDDTYITGY